METEIDAYNLFLECRVQMNLASRCREALSHVAMLKRELAAHQRRSAEALAMQRQSAERAMASPPTTPSATPAPPLGSPARDSTPQGGTTTTPKRNLEVNTSTPSVGHSSPPLQQIASPHQNESPGIPTPPPKLTPRRAMDVAKELEILDETVASHALKAQATPTPPKAPTPEEPTPLESPPTLSEPVDSDDFEEESLSTTNQLHPPHSVDDVPGHRPKPAEVTVPAEPDSANNTSTESTGSASGVVSPTKTYFPQSASPKVDNYNEEYPADFSAVRKRAAVRPKLGMLAGFAEGEDEGSTHSLGKRSSLDAFEASFALDFPDSFSPRDATVAEEKKSEIYNPFNSPARVKSAESPQGQHAIVSSQPLQPPESPQSSQEGRKDPPGKVRTSQRSMHNKVFTALSHSPRATDESRSPRPAASTRQPSPGAQQPPINGLRKNGVSAKVLNPPPLDTKPAETGRSRYDRLAQQRKAAPFDEPKGDDLSRTDAPSSPARHDQQEEVDEKKTPVSVKDRATLFNGGGPRSPEKESMRLNSLGRYNMERSLVDEGDIPMISNIGRSKASPPRQDPAPTATNGNVTSSSKNPSFVRNRTLPWEADGEDVMEQRRRQYPDSKLRRGELYSFSKEGKGQRE